MLHTLNTGNRKKPKAIMVSDIKLGGCDRCGTHGGVPHREAFGCPVNMVTNTVIDSGFATYVCDMCWNSFPLLPEDNQLTDEDLVPVTSSAGSNSVPLFYFRPP